jgi:hypothetical protein
MFWLAHWRWLTTPCFCIANQWDWTWTLFLVVCHDTMSICATGSWWCT